MVNAIRIVKLYQVLSEAKKEFVLSKQSLRSGTAVGALIREAEHAESKNNFKASTTMQWKSLNF
jgi:four helix bundle protein